MAEPQATTIRSFDTPLRGPGRSAPSLLEDLLLFDPRQNIQPGYHLLEDGSRSFSRSLYIGQLLPPGSCTHDFRLKERQSVLPLLDERPSPETLWQVAAVCQKCRIHLLLQVDYRAAWHDQPCPTYENPLHHLARSPWRQDVAYRHLARENPDNTDEVHVYECTSPRCSAIVTIHLMPPFLQPEAVHLLLDKELLRKRTDAAFELKKGHTEGMKRPLPIDVLVDLRAYLRNAWRQDVQTQISLDNKRFVVRFGPEGTACADVLEMLGFELNPGDSWNVPRPDPNEPLPVRSPQNVYLDNVEAELDALIARRPIEERQAAHELTQPEPAWTELSRALSCQNYDKDPSSRTSKRSLIQRSRPFTILGIPEDASDDLIIWAYQRQMALEADSMQTAQLVTALEDIQKMRRSERLGEQVAIEWSQGRYGEQAISDAYRSLGLSPEAGLNDDEIIGNFESRLQDAPGQGPAMRESLARIGEHRNSQRLVDYARNEISTYEDALRYLGAEESTDDQFLVAVYATKVGDNNANQEMAQKAMRLIADSRGSEELKAFVAAGCQGELQETKMDIGEAFHTLQVEDRTIGDETLVMVYEMRCADDPANAVKYRKAIETIAEELNSPALKEKLQMPGAQQVSKPAVSLTEPVGLDNIGNTCYLNSLLQSLFTIGPVRDIVLNFENYKQNLDPRQIEAKRVGQRLVSPKEVLTAQNFVTQLGQLFHQMITTPDPAIRPAQELARLTLETGLVKSGRRSSTLQGQRRPTLAMIDGKPTLGPLPQPVVNIELVQSPESPELVDMSGLSTEQQNTGQDSDTAGAQPNHIPSEDNIGDTGEKTLDSNSASEKEQLSTAEKNGATTEGLVNGIHEHSVTSGVQDAASEETEEQQPRLQADMPPAVSDTTGEAKMPETTPQHPPLVYKPPEGKPPPVPPRPLTTATLEQYARQQDVSEVLGHAIFQLSCAIRARGFDKSGEQQDEVHDTLYGEEQVHVLHGNASPQMPVQFLFLTLPIYNEPKDVYAAIDNDFDLEERGSSEIYKTITKLPPVLCMILGRVMEDATGQRKVNSHVDIPSTVYMDRYMDAPAGSTLVARRAQTWQYKKELRKLRARLNELEPKGKPPVDEALDAAIAAFQHITEVSATEKLDGLSTEATTVEQMVFLSQQIKAERAALKENINLLERQINDSFTESAFRQQEYKLHAAFFHRGTVGSGHYWVYIFDHVNEIWRKYNDDHVTHVTNLKEIFGNPQDDRSNPNWSPYNPANPYFLVYVRSDKTKPEANIIETVVRNPIVPPPPPATSSNTDEGYADVPLEAEADLRPLGTDPLDYGGNSSHHEFAGQPSQMRHMPPNESPPPLRAQKNTNQQDEEMMEDWEREEVKQAIERSLQPEGEGKWDDSQNTSIPSNKW